MSGITIVGLGPGSADLLTAEARAVLDTAHEIWMYTKDHPAAEVLPPHLTVRTLDDLEDGSSDFAFLCRKTAKRVVELGERPEGVVYGVPGSPWLGEVTVRFTVEEAQARNLPVRLVHGLSVVEPTLAALGIHSPENLQIADATAVAAGYFPPFEADRPVLVTSLYGRNLAARVKAVLLELYAPDHPVTLVEAAGTSYQQTFTCTVQDVDRFGGKGYLSNLYIPPRQAPASFTAFMEIIAHLRSPEGCPWDREQTHRSLRPFLLEEAYEVLHALDREDTSALREELGDLLLQIALHAQIATEEGNFTIADVLATVGQKMIRRHPHVFGDVEVKSAQEVLRNWEQLKREEKGDNGEEDPFAGIPPALPALAFAQKMTRRAVKLGWRPPPLETLWENWQRAPSAHTLGRLLLGLAEAAREAHIDAESALREAAGRLADEWRSVRPPVEQA